ncbi:MAG: DUF4298 domain-containing protein [Oscillospiraceae bacterium]|nr:DUF4298 domain-containing protein [Oscillospiraceae bacterium]
MDPIDRIRSAEERLNRAAKAMKELEFALEAYEAIGADVEIVSGYYGSPDWFSDLEAYDSGKLGVDPTTLPAGILSEDAAYDLLTEYNDLAMEMSRIAGEALAKEL